MTLALLSDSATRPLTSCVLCATASKSALEHSLCPLLLPPQLPAHPAPWLCIPWNPYISPLRFQHPKVLLKLPRQHRLTAPCLPLHCRHCPLMPPLTSPAPPLFPRPPPHH